MVSIYMLIFNIGFQANKIVVSHFVHVRAVKLQRTEIVILVCLPVCYGLSSWLFSGNPEIPVLRISTALE